MTAWVYLPKIALHPGQTGGSQALVIAAQMTAGDPEAKPAGAACRVGRSRSTKASRGCRLLDSAGKVIRALAPYQQAGESRHVESPHLHLRRQQNGKRLRVLHERHQDADRARILWRAGFDHCAGAEGQHRPTPRRSPSGRRRTARRGSPARLASSASSTASSAKKKRAWPPRGRRLRRLRRRDRAQLSAAEKDALKLYYLMYRDAGYQALSGGVHARERRASRDRAALEHGDGDGRAAGFEGGGAICCFAGCTISRASCSTPRTPSFLPPMAPELPRNRLGLARWMVDRANPLFARVTVNRFWQEFFGAGHPRVGRRLRRAGAAAVAS